MILRGRSETRDVRMAGKQFRDCFAQCELKSIHRREFDVRFVQTVRCRHQVHVVAIGTRDCHVGKRTTIRLASPGVKAGVLGAALLAVHELEAGDDVAAGASPVEVRR